MKIEAVINTHVHADHRSGERRLRELVPSATIYLNESADVRYHFHPLRDNDEISLGNVIIRVWHTPGHTPESLTLLVIDTSRGNEPWMALTGDTLLVGDVGRPDFGGKEAAEALHASLRRLMKLPDYVEVYPAHISGSPCGRAMSGKPSSTIGFERRHNSAARIADRDDFVKSIYEGLPPKPEGFEQLIMLNRG